jgi:hypothetical protein
LGAYPASANREGGLQVGVGAVAGRGPGAQLASGVAGMVITLRCRHPYDVFWMHEQTEEIARDTLFRGTALSAWVSKLVLQAALTAVVAARLGRRAQQALGALGALLAAGYPG